MTVHLVNLTNPMMMKGPVRAAIPISSQRVRIRVPAGKRISKTRLLVAGGETPHRTDGDAHRDRSAFDPYTRGNRTRFRLEVKGQMTDMFDITRRTFLRNSALLTAGTALAHAAELPQATEAASPSPSALVFPYGAVYFRKTNPPEPRLGPRPRNRGTHRDEHFPPLVHVVRHRGRAGQV